MTQGGEASSQRAAHPWRSGVPHLWSIDTTCESQSSLAVVCSLLGCPASQGHGARERGALGSRVVLLVTGGLELSPQPDHSSPANSQSWV